MTVRNYSPADYDQVLRIWDKLGDGYPFPQLHKRDADGNVRENPLFCSKKVLIEDGQVAVAALGRITTEVYLLLDPERGTPERRRDQFAAIHRAMETDLFNRGYEDVHGWLPPRLVKPFGRRLENLGWVRDDDWTPYCKTLTPPKEG